MALAVLRGCKFIKIQWRVGLVRYVPAPFEGGSFNQALDDVGRALGHANRHGYNRACIDNPREVRRQLRAL